MTATSTTQNPITRSEIFSWYNRARVCSKLDTKRTNKALGYLMSKDQSWREKYQSTTHSCDCADHRRNPSGTCKHMVAKMIEARIYQNRPVKVTTPAPTQPSPIFNEMADGTISINEQVNPHSFRIHYFDNQSDAENWIKTHSHGAIVQAGQVNGKRLGNSDHRFGGRDA